MTNGAMQVVRRVTAIGLGMIFLAGWPEPSASGGISQPRQCSKAEERAAEDIAGRLKTWPAVYDAYRRYSHCDDGSIGQGFSESITVLLSKRWNRFDEFRRLARKDGEFESFVVRHIDLTVPVERLEVIALNARQRCGAGGSLCERIAQRANER